MTVASTLDREALFRKESFPLEEGDHDLPRSRESVPDVGDSTFTWGAGTARSQSVPLPSPNRFAGMGAGPATLFCAKSFLRAWLAAPAWFQFPAAGFRRSAWPA